MTNNNHKYKKILEISKDLKSKFFFNYEIYKYTWFKAGGNADVFCLVNDINELAIILKNSQNIPFHILGAGTNILIRDKGFKGIIFKLGKSFNHFSINNNTLSVGASILDTNLSKFALINSIKNMEFYSGIPGTVGGAVKMNAGCYGNETKNVLKNITIIDQHGKIKIVKNSQLNLSYRSSNIKNEIITSANFNIEYGENETIKNKIKEIKKNREQTQPIKSKTSGSTFKNPKNMFAAKLIEMTGCKGLNIGDAEVSNKHANFLINTNNANATEIEDLGKTIIEKVYKKFKIYLEWEVEIIGDL